MRKKITLNSIEIHALSSSGSGVGRHEGKVVFVPYTVPGDIVDVKIRKNKKDYAEGIGIRFHQYSKERENPFCEYFGECGGCKWQHVSYENQLKWKQQIVEDAFQRIGGLDFPNILPILPSSGQTFYRNKLEYTFSADRWFTKNEILSGVDFTDRRGLGFHVPGSYDKVLNIRKCFLQPDPSNEIRNSLFDFAVKNDYSFFHLRKKEGLLRNLIIRTTNTGEFMVIVIFYKNDPEKIQLLMDFLKTTFPEIHSLNYVINPKANETIFDLEAVLYHGRPYIVEQLGDVRFKIGTHSFFQTNAIQAKQLYDLVKEKAAFQGNENVLDLYTGLGSIALYIANSVKSVIGIEEIPQAIEDAKENAQFNEVKNCTFHAADVRDFFSKNTTLEKPDVVITDPPRAGMHPDVCNDLLDIAAEKVVYVSCNPSTQARDLKILSEKYVISEVQPVDMFPQTAHVENIAVLKRK